MLKIVNSLKTLCMLMINIPQLHEEFGEYFQIPNGEALLVLRKAKVRSLVSTLSSLTRRAGEGFRHFWSV